MTRSDSIFENTIVTAFPCPDGTNFADPGPPGTDITPVFLKGDSTGDAVGTSYDRVVTVVRAVPEPSSVLLLGAGGLALTLARVRPRAK